MQQRVTFDTNVLDLICRPERFPKDPRQAQMQRVHTALATGQIQGFFSATMLTIEGIMRRDRAAVFSDTRVAVTQEYVGTTPTSTLSQEIPAWIGDDDIETITVKMAVDQPARNPLHPETAARARAAHALGLRVLKAVPRIGAFNLTDPTGEWYLSRGTGNELAAWIDKSHTIAAAIEKRGLGFAQIKELGRNLAAGGPTTAWFHALNQATDIHQQRAIERAFGEWADADTLATHIAYGLDVFCTADVGKSNGTCSILDPVNRKWLQETYGVTFMSLDELAFALTRKP